MKRIVSAALAGVFLLPSLSLLSGCGAAEDEIVLRVYNWEEYIDEGGEGTLIYDELHLFDENGKAVSDGAGNHIHGGSALVDDAYLAWYEETTGEALDPEGPAILDDFEKWYERTYGEKVRVEYSTFGTNEDMYNEIQLGNVYDLLCPSDYMIMKLAAEGKLEKYDESFFDESDPLNCYARNVSPFIRDKFATNAGLPESEYLWKDYAAGYMWGTTGFIYNPAEVDPDELAELGWEAFTNEKYANKITAKDNVRDTYFAALGATYQDELKALPRDDSYNGLLTGIFNRTAEEYIPDVYETLMKIKSNVYSFETDTGKADMVSGKIWLNYAWSGDAVYAMTLAEDEDDLTLDFYVPEAGTNLWFDGWVMPKGVTERGTKRAAEAFVNFLSMPQNAMRNSYYIGYTSAIAGGEDREMLAYADYLYGTTEEDAEDPVDYDLTYFFRGGDGDERVSILAEREQTVSRQLYAQFPPEDVIGRCAVMNYYGDAVNARINELWSQVKAEMLDAWAIIVICVAVAAFVVGVIAVKFGGKIELRRKPKRGYVLTGQERV